MLRQASNLVVLDLFNREKILLSRDSLCYVKKLRVLTLRHVIIDSFEVFDVLADLVELNVEIDCALLSRRVERFARLPKLTKLKLRLLNVEWISPDAFDHLTSISSFEFDFGLKMLETFETGLAPCSLRVNQDLKLLKLNSTTVSSIENIEFNGSFNRQDSNVSSMPLTGLKTLEISPTNDLSFLQMTNLEDLCLKLNGNFSFLDNGRLACLHSLKSLVLHGQSIRTSFACLNGELFSGLTSLKKLSIKHFDSLTRLEPGAFKHLSNLLELDLNSNQIEAIEPGTFAHLSKLKVLSMCRNKLTQFPSYCFHELPNLEELKLDNNRIGTVPSAYSLVNDERVATTSMNNFRMLSLISNPLKSLPRNAFASFPALVSISLKQCKIKEVEKGALDGGLVNLRFLSLQHNEFSSFDLSVFDTAELANLSLLVLSNSHLTSVTTSCATEPDTFLVKCLNKVTVRVYSRVQKEFPLLERLSQEGKIELI
jgi:Leucine-rich repeat (LRR) protein